MCKKFVKLDRELKISYSTQIHRKSCEIFNFILFVFTKKIVKRENSSSVNKFLVKIRQTTLTFFFIHFNSISRKNCQSETEHLHSSWTHLKKNRQIISLFLIQLKNCQIGLLLPLSIKKIVKSSLRKIPWNQISRKKKSSPLCKIPSKQRCFHKFFAEKAW